MDKLRMKIEEFENKLNHFLNELDKQREDNQRLKTENAELLSKVSQLEHSVNERPSPEIIEEYKQKIDSYISLIDDTLRNFNPQNS